VKSVSDGEVDALLCSAFAVEELVRPDADALVVVVASPDGSRPRARALEQLASLPCIVIGDGHSPVDPPPHLDVLAEEGVATVDRLLATIETNPIAAVTLAMLLRGAESRSLGAGLVAESSAYSLLQAGPEFARWLAGWNRRERPPEAEPPVLVHRDGDSLELTLNRPHVRNALDRSMRDALLAALAVPLADPSVATVEVSGRGPAFCSGGDLDDFGSCAGSGVELPGFATHVVAAADTRCSLPEVGLGLIPGAGGTVSLTRRIGRHRVALLALSGSAVDAATAHSWGLVDEVLT
jgi:hypothetical protein